MGSPYSQLIMSDMMTDDNNVGERRLKSETRSDSALRDYASLSQPRVLTTSITQSEIATIEGDRYSFSKSFSNVDTNIPIYVLIENPEGSGVNMAFQQRSLKTYSSGLVTFQVLWDYDVSTATKTTITAFNENNEYRGIKDTKAEISLLNSATTPPEGDWVINGAATVISDGIQREIDFIPPVGQGSNSTGGVSPALGFRLYKEGTGAIVKIVSSANDNRVELGYSWVEAPTTL